MALIRDLVAVGMVNREAALVGDVALDAIRAAGTTQATAFALTATINEVTVINAGVDDGVILPKVAMASGSRIVIKNNAAAALNVYPNIDESINTLAINISIAVAAGAAVTMCKVSTARWISI